MKWRRTGSRYRPRRAVPGDRGTAGELTKRVLEGYNISTDIHAYQLVTDWDVIVGARVAARTTPMNVGAAMANGVLTVRVANSAWLQELSFIKEQLLAKVNEYVGTANRPVPIHDIRFFHGNAPRGRADELQQAQSQQLRPALSSRPLPPPASGDRLEQIQQETADVDDPELREAIRKARRLLDI